MRVIITWTDSCFQAVCARAIIYTLEVLAKIITILINYLPPLQYKVIYRPLKIGIRDFLIIQILTPQWNSNWHYERLRRGLMLYWKKNGLRWVLNLNLILAIQIKLNLNNFLWVLMPHWCFLDSLKSPSIFLRELFRKTRRWVHLNARFNIDLKSTPQNK